MDSIESARQIAVSLHKRAVEMGDNPWCLFDFALAEAARRGYDVEAVNQGAAILNGSRATLIADEELILYENIGTPFEKAFLIAHEIGHIELGDTAESTSAIEIDPTRSSEASPIGVDRVVDYGARQRREIQMDLFAREFLIPREWLKKLYIEDKFNIREIAEKLGAPFEVVALQLLDELLLPQPDNDGEVRSSQIEKTLNDSQRDAANHRGHPFLLEAGPGTGKTQTLVNRVEGLLKDGIDPRRILILTFSNKAAGEMAERIAAKNVEAAASMWIGTFHAFGLDIIRRFYSDLGFNKEPRLIDRTEAVELLEDEFTRLNLKHYQNIYDPTQKILDLLSAISRAKDEVIEATTYSELANAMLAKASTPEMRDDAEKVGEIEKVYKVYETLKNFKSCIDFGDLVMLPVKLLENNKNILEHFRSLYDHVLVDEYQDVNRSSVRLLKALCSSGENLWVVGDSKQSIYRFRGASSVNMSRFKKVDFPQGIDEKLDTNYRSHEEIVNCFSSFAIDMAANDGDPNLKANRGAGGHSPEFITTEKSENQIVSLAAKIEDMRKGGYKYRNQAVLCSGNDRLSVLAEDLERLGIPVLFLGSLFERPEVKDIFALLSILTDSRAMGLIRIACWPEFKMSMEDVNSVLIHLRTYPAEPQKWLKNIFNISGLSDNGKSSLHKLANVLEGFSNEDQPWQIITTVLLDRTRILARLSFSTDIADKTRCIAIWQLMNFIRASQPSSKGLPVNRLLERVRRLLRLGDDRDLRHLPNAAQHIDAVRLMTIHGAKGLEFEVVHIPGMSQGTLPRSYKSPVYPIPNGLIEGANEENSAAFLKAEHEKEQECLFYVALSRAKDRLFIYAPTKKVNNSSWARSPYISRFENFILPTHISTTREIPIAPENANIDVYFDGELIFDASHLALYESCPRRFFYTHLLQIGGRSVKTPFLKMHDAVRSVLRNIIENSHDGSEINLKVTAALKQHGLDDHGYFSDFESLAHAMLNYFVASRAGAVATKIEPITLKLGGEKITVLPDEILTMPNGIKMIRRVKTGHIRKDDDKIDTAAFVLAAKEFLADCKVETIYLADQSIQEASFTTKVLQNRQDKLSTILDKIRKGQFPAEQSSFTCPSCPAFFICGQVPEGVLQKN